jgi:hypothetical protein
VSRRRALTRRLCVDEQRADDLSRWLLAHPEAFDAEDLRCWRIGSDSWLALACEQLPPLGRVERPVGVFVVPALSASDGWQLMPVLALEMIRLIAELGGRAGARSPVGRRTDQPPRGPARTNQHSHAARRTGKTIGAVHARSPGESDYNGLEVVGRARPLGERRGGRAASAAEINAFVELALGVRLPADPLLLSAWRLSMACRGEQGLGVRGAAAGRRW